jgi:hypothetical protein
VDSYGSPDARGSQDHRETTVNLYDVIAEQHADRIAAEKPTQHGASRSLEVRVAGQGVVGRVIRLRHFENPLEPISFED